MGYFEYLNIFVNICPHCEKPTQYFPSPYYIHHCKNCGEWCSQSELKEGIYVELAHKQIREKKEDIERIEKYLKEKINIYEEEKEINTKYNRFDIMEI